MDYEPSQWVWGWREREQVRAARRSLMGPGEDDLWGGGGRVWLLGGWQGHPQDGNAGGGRDLGESVRSV